MKECAVACRVIAAASVAIALASSAFANAGDGVFTSATPLTFARNHAAATVLQDGSVLIIGPYYDADRYVAETHAMVATDGVNVARDLASAFTLPNGHVLLVGGNSNEVRSEIYDASANAWTWGAAMVHGRYHHQAAQLPDGSVLVAGGSVSDTTVSATAELYNPLSDQFEAVGDMTRPRYYGSAEALPDGRVLVAGGYDATNHLIRCSDIYNPASRTFAAGPCFADVIGLYWPSSARLADGRVLIAGGFTLVGQASWRTTAQAEIFNPATNSFRSATMWSERIGHRLTTLANGQVLVTGGLNDFGSVLASSELFDPTSNTFRVGPALVAGRFGHTSTALPGGGALIAGGQTVNGESSWSTTTEAYRADEVFASGFD